MRREFSKYITELIDKDPTVYLLVGDIGYGLFDKLKVEHPDKIINLGVCEQAMIGMAAGMALLGLKPYVFTITPFLVERTLEQIKIDINMNNVNVKLIGYDDYPTAGPTHAVTNDGKFMDMFENIMCYWPKDSFETKIYLEQTYKLECPTFIRLQKDKNI